MGARKVFGAPAFVEVFIESLDGIVGAIGIPSVPAA
jgi:hypothetical protein